MPGVRGMEDGWREGGRERREREKETEREREREGERERERESWVLEVRSSLSHTHLTLLQVWVHWVLLQHQ